MNFIFCLYDLNYTDDFLKSWINLCHLLNKKKITYTISPGDSCNAFYAKQMSFKGNVLAGKNQKPFQGKYKYNYIVFLSGNILFDTKDFVNLYNTIYNNKLDFISAKVKNRYKLLDKKEKYEYADFLDFDMVLVKSGIFEKLSYPWFKPWKARNKEEQSFVDIDVCKRLQNEANIDLLIDPTVLIKRRVTSYE